MDENTESVAIPDVTEEVTPEERPLSPRELAIEAISEQRNALLDEEMGVTKPEAIEPVQDGQAANLPVAPEVQKVKVKVDGVEHEVDVDTLVRTYQKNSAADRRLEEATRLLREAEEAAANAASTGNQVSGKTPDDLHNEAAELIDKVFDGDKDAAADALIQLLTRTKGGDQPTHAPVQIDERQLTARVLETMAVNTAFEKIQSDYPDLIADPDLEYMTALKIDRAVEQGIPRSKAMLEVAASMYKTLGKEPAGRQQESANSGKSTRQDNKARLDNIPTASASAIPPESPQENTSPSSVIQEMARKRLGQSLAL